MKLLSPIQNDYDIVHKKYVDDRIAEVEAPIIDVDILPEITNSNRNNIYRLNDNLYYAKPVYTTENISVGNNLSNAKIEFNIPSSEIDLIDNIDILVGSSQNYKIYFTVSDYSGAYIIDYIGSISQNESLENVDTVTVKRISILGASNVEEVYRCVNGNVVLNYHGIANLSSNFGYVSEINSVTMMQYIKKVVGTSYVWAKIGEGSKEIAISTEEPTEEVLWIDPEEDDIDTEEIVVDLNSTFPIGSEYITSNNVNPGTKIGGTWQLVKDYRGGELIAFGQLTNKGTGVTLVNGTYQAWSGTFLSDNVNTYIKNYYSGSVVLEYISGAFKVHSRGIVGLVEAEIILSGHKNSECYAIWYSNNANDLPTGVSLIGDNKALMTVGVAGNTNYGGCRNSYMFEVTAGPNNDVEFYVNPWMIAYPYGAEFYPGSGGVKCSIKVKVYTTKETRFLWKRIA